MDGWSAGARRLTAPGLLAGIGVGGPADGIVLHWVPGIHHVRDDPGGPVSRDLGLLALSAVPAAAGALRAARGARARMDDTPIQFAGARPIHEGHGNGRPSRTRERARRPR